MLLKLIGVGLSAVIINLILKQYKPEFAILINVCSGLIMFLLVIDGLSEIINEVIGLQELSSIKLDIITPILKVIGVGYITEFASDLAEDSGNKSVANKIIFGGKIAICLLALPVIKMLINAILSLI